MLQQCVGLRLHGHPFLKLAISYYKYCNFQLSASIVWVPSIQPSVQVIYNNVPTSYGSWARWPCPSHTCDYGPAFLGSRAT